MQHYIQYRLPLHSKPLNLRYLFLQYPNITYDYERNMIIITSFPISCKRAQSFFGTMEDNFLTEKDIEHFNCTKISNLLIPYLNLQLKLYPNEHLIIDEICQDAYYKYLVIGNGFWSQYYHFSPLNTTPSKEVQYSPYIHSIITDSIYTCKSYLLNSLRV